MLVQFGQLGVAYAQLALGVAAPRVGLLTIGTEPGKGNKFTRRAHDLLAADPPHGALPLGFAGNVGYSTPEHRAAIIEHGPSALHRRSFQSIAYSQLEL